MRKIKPWELLRKANGGIPMSQDEVGQMVGITRQAVHNIEHNALGKIAAAIMKYWTEPQ